MLNTKFIINVAYTMILLSSFTYHVTKVDAYYSAFTV